MREICREDEGARGSIPRGGSDNSVGVAGTFPPSTEQGSVEIAKPLEGGAPGGAQGACLPPVGGDVWVSVGGVVVKHRVDAHSHEQLEGAVLVTTDGKKTMATLPEREGVLWWRSDPGFGKAPSGMSAATVKKPERKRRTKAEMALTHGKNGVPELPAIAEKTPEPLPVTDGEPFGAHEGGDYETPVPPSRRCEGCDAFLDVSGTDRLCSVCREDADNAFVTPEEIEVEAREDGEVEVERAYLALLAAEEVQRDAILARELAFKAFAEAAMAHRRDRGAW